MTPEIREQYRTFFKETAGGDYFLKELNRMVNSNHESAEDDPELARDFTQRAKGNREVSAHIDSVLIEVKKGPRRGK